MKRKFDDIDSLLIWLYIFIDKLYNQTELPLYSLRLSNNSVPFFTDTELFTCAIFTELLKCRSKKDGYLYIRRHYLSWFPNLPTYEVYNRKLNKYQEAICYIFKIFRNLFAVVSDQKIAQIDTAPITVCKAQHSSCAKAAKPFVSKGFCPSKKMYYVGVKLQIISQNRANQLPYPIDYHIETAQMHDLDIAKLTLPYLDLNDIDLYGDRGYIDKNFQLDLFENNHINLITPNKKLKGQPPLTLFQKAYNSIHSSIRQPIDTLFGWIEDQTNIENASKVRSVDGLFYHINIKMLAALLLLVIKF